ncbi:aquaporin Z [Pseudofrankia sp. DC12]|uniref:aquaporin Z n=1 Tax=Pseudofrankia sp. DC12 TaxID=683315 RepID=UPI0005F76EBF|nr:aquaporin Z [Pseudofrankia sp. DC12]
MAVKAGTAAEARADAASSTEETRLRVRKLVAEAIGTFVLVLGGVGTAVLAGDFMGTLGVALAFGLTLVVLMYVIGPVSGCHVNPAVTTGLCAAKKIAPKDAAAYIVAQCVGAIVAAGAIYLIADAGPFGYSAKTQGLGANGYGLHSPAGFGMGGAFLAEVLLTGLLVFTCLGATHIQSPVGFAGIAIGFVLAVCNLVSIPVDNTSVNPARSLGPAVFAGGWALSQLWLFIVAPIVGALLAAAVHRVLRPEPGGRLSTAARALPSESEARIAQETARLMRMPVGAPRHLADGRQATAEADDHAQAGADRPPAGSGRDRDRFRDRKWNRDRDWPGGDADGS